MTAELSEVHGHRKNSVSSSFSTVCTDHNVTMCFSLLYFPLKELNECDNYILPSNSITHVVIEIHINWNTIQISFFITLKRTQGGWPWSIASQADILGSYSDKQTLHYNVITFSFIPLMNRIFLFNTLGWLVFFFHDRSHLMPWSCN